MKFFCFYCGCHFEINFKTLVPCVYTFNSADIIYLFEKGIFRICFVWFGMNVFVGFVLWPVM